MATLLLGTGFAAGLVSAGDLKLVSLVGDGIEVTPERVPEEKTPAAKTVAIPERDVPGADLDGLYRYPDSVRIEYIRERQEELIWTEVEYLTDASMGEARDYYRDSFRQSDWSVNDIGFAQNSWVFFVVKDEREVFVELKPRGSGVEIDLEQTEPVPPRKAKPEQQSRPEKQPAPEQPSPEEAAPSPPVYRGDDDEYEDDGDYDD